MTTSGSTNKVAVAACPFCGGTDTACGIADEEFGRFWVECICGARGPTVETLKDARPAWNKRLAPEPRAGHGWTCVTERLPTENELKAGVLFGIHWPEGRIEMVSWDMEYQHDYDLMCRHFEVFQPDRSQGTGYWRTSASIAPPRSPTTKAEK